MHKIRLGRILKNKMRYDLSFILLSLTPPEFDECLPGGLSFPVGDKIALKVFPWSLNFLNR